MPARLGSDGIRPRLWEKNPKRTCPIEDTEIPLIIYRLVADALDRRPVVPSWRQTIVRLRGDSKDSVGHLAPDENTRHVEISDGKAVAHQIIVPC